jgi:bifunctional non-homologous end joining protein LigD
LVGLNSGRNFSGSDQISTRQQLKPVLAMQVDAGGLQIVRAQGFEGLVARRRDSKYGPGERSAAWAKMRVSQTQDLVIGGYTV